MKKVLVTGAAGFIGSHLCHKLLRQGYQVVGVDNLNRYYDVGLKHARLQRLSGNDNFRFYQLDIQDKDRLLSLFECERFPLVVNLAAQVGVRYSLINPDAYVSSNVTGFLNVLEGCKRAATQHLVFASSSSVYGANTRMPFSVHSQVDHPVSLYAATKKANELMAHTYASAFGLPCTGLRLFTVYGPWGRPDMALFRFTKAILEGRAIDVYNYGKMQRDFTYIDDIVEGISRVMELIPGPDPDWCGDRPDCATSFAPYKLYNIGGNQPVELIRFIEELEKCLGRPARKNFLPLQTGDVLATCADMDDLMAAVDFRPQTTIENGIAEFVSWYQDYYRTPTLAPMALPS